MEVIRGHLGCPLSGGCPLFGGSAIGGSTVDVLGPSCSSDPELRSSIEEGGALAEKYCRILALYSIVIVIKTGSVLLLLNYQPSARMRSEGYSTWFDIVCLSVCLSVTTFSAATRNKTANKRY